jgi:hypothetical protein
VLPDRLVVRFGPSHRAAESPDAVTHGPLWPAVPHPFARNIFRRRSHRARTP